MTVSSLGMLATGVLSFTVCRVLKWSPTVADATVRRRDAGAGGRGGCVLHPV